MKLGKSHTSKNKAPLRPKRAKVEFRGTENVPRLSDRSWNLATPPVFNFIFEKDRTIDEIVEWGKARGVSGTMIRQLLAWLSVDGQVHYDTTGKIWRLGPEPRI